MFTLAMVIVQAADRDLGFEAESAVTSGTAATMSDPSASGGQALAFKSAGVNCDGETAGPLRSDNSFTGTTTNVAVRYSISLPDDYYTACKEYPVLYSLHGKTESNSTFIGVAESIREAVSAGVLENVIIITPDSYSDGRWENGGNGPAEDNFIQELIPYAEKHFRIKKGPSYRLLSGFSMGGHGAFRFGVKYPTMFAAVYSVDGAMGSAEDYTQFVDGVKAHNPKIVTVGGQACGSRVETVINAFKNLNVTIPYTYYDIEHDYELFLAQDRQAGWPAVAFLQANLGRTIQ